MGSQFLGRAVERGGFTGGRGQHDLVLGGADSIVAHRFGHPHIHAGELLQPAERRGGIIRGVHGFAGGVRLGVFRLVRIGGILRLFIVLRGFRKPTLAFGECGVIGVDHVTSGLSTVEDAHLPVINAAHHILPLCGIPHQFIIASESAGFLVLHLHHRADVVLEGRLCDLLKAARAVHAALFQGNAQLQGHSGFLGPLHLHVPDGPGQDAVKVLFQCGESLAL